MITNPQTGGKNYPIGIPKVYKGQAITASKFNNLSTAIQKNSIVGVKGAELSKTSSGVSVVIPNASVGVLPFEVMVSRNTVIVFDGNIWVNKNYEADAKQNTPAYKGTMKIPKGDWDCNIVGKGTVDYPYGIKFPVDGGDKMVWFDTQVEKPELKYTDKGTFEAAEGGVAIAWITSLLQVYQFVSNDIWLRDTSFDNNIHPFKIIGNYEEGTGGNAGSIKFRVNYGTVNNIVPKYENGKYISDKTVRLPMSTSPTFVWLRLSGSAYPSPFPVTATIVANSNSVMTDTITSEGEGYAYVLIGQIQSVSGNAKAYDIQQAVTTSLRAECHRLRTTAVDTFYYSI